MQWCLSVASGVAFLCTCFASSLQDKLWHTVRMAGLMAYTLTKDTRVDMPQTGV